MHRRLLKFFRKNDCFNLDELNDSLVVTTALRKPNKQENRSAGMKVDTQQNNEHHFDEEFHSSFDIFVEKCMKEVILMKVMQKTSDMVFSLCTDLIKEYSSFLCQVFENSIRCDPLLNEILSRESTNVCEKLAKKNAAYKRKKGFEQNELYVQPTERNLGINAILRNKRFRGAERFMQENRAYLWERLSLLRTSYAGFTKEHQNLGSILSKDRSEQQDAYFEEIEETYRNLVTRLSPRIDERCWKMQKICKQKTQATKSSSP